jgi:hypothetical protein
MADWELSVCRQACHGRPRAGTICSWRPDQSNAIAGLPRPKRRRALRTIVREPDQGHGANHVAARHGAQRHDPYGAREGQAQGNGNRDTRRQDAVPGQPDRAPRLIGSAAATGTGKITSTGRWPDTWQPARLALGLAVRRVRT